MQDKICTKPLLDSFLMYFHTYISIILKERIPPIYLPPRLYGKNTLFTFLQNTWI